MIMEGKVRNFVVMVPNFSLWEGSSSLEGVYQQLLKLHNSCPGWNTISLSIAWSSPGDMEPFLEGEREKPDL